MKKCSKCKIEKDYSEFYTRKEGSDGYRSSCKKCDRDLPNRKKIREEAATRELIRRKEREIQSQLTTKRCSDCTDLKSTSEFGWHKNRSRWHKRCKSCKNKLVRESMSEEQREKNRQSCKEYAKSEKGRQTIREGSKRRRLNPAIRFKDNTRRRLSYALKEGKKSEHLMEIIGCSLEELKLYLESTFEANYGMPRSWMESFEYEIDHIIPLSSAKSLEEVIKLNHYTNLQILTKEDNLNKSNKLDWTIEENSII